MGRPTDEDIGLLQQRTLRQLRAKGELESFFSGIVTHIYPTNADVNRENTLAREKLPGCDHLYDCSYSVSNNLSSEWSDRDESFYQQWSMRGGAPPAKWVVETQPQQQVCPPESPWYRVLARYVRMEQGFLSYKRGAAVLCDDECLAALAQ